MNTVGIKPRKMTLYNGPEKLSELAIPSGESNHRALQMVKSELSRTPLLSHAIFRDRAGTEWFVQRDTNIVQKLRILLLAK